jgi:hypothetical protein
MTRMGTNNDRNALLWTEGLGLFEPLFSVRSQLQPLYSRNGSELLAR